MRGFGWRYNRGFGWRYNAFPASGPRKADLDQLWPDTPIILIAIDGHSAWVNSKALAMAKVTKATKDPLPGFSYFQRGASSTSWTSRRCRPSMSGSAWTRRCGPTRWVRPTSSDWTG